MTRGRFSFPVTKLTCPEVGKWVTVNINGNCHHEAKILISPYTTRKFENLLTHLTDKLKPPFGAVWHLFTEDGVEVKDLDDVKGGQTYIASGRAKPLFPVRTKTGRARRDSAGSERELRSHSAVGSLGGGGAWSRGRSGGGRTAAHDAPSAARAAHGAASDTNVKSKLAMSAGSPGSLQTRPSRPAPAPRRGKARSRTVGQSESMDQVWDGPLHNQQQSHYQQAIPAMKKRQSTGKVHHDEDYDSEYEEAVLGMPCQNVHLVPRNSPRKTSKSATGGRTFARLPQAKLNM